MSASSARRCSANCFKTSGRRPRATILQHKSFAASPDEAGALPRPGAAARLRGVEAHPCLGPLQRLRRDLLQRKPRLAHGAPASTGEGVRVRHAEGPVGRPRRSRSAAAAAAVPAAAQRTSWRWLRRLRPAASGRPASPHRRSAATTRLPPPLTPRPPRASSTSHSEMSSTVAVKAWAPEFGAESFSDPRKSTRARISI